MSSKMYLQKQLTIIRISKHKAKRYNLKPNSQLKKKLKIKRVMPNQNRKRIKFKSICKITLQ